MSWILNKTMIWGAACVAIMIWGISMVDDGVRHHGPGYLPAGEDSDENILVPEINYKRTQIGMGLFIFGLGGFFWYTVAKHEKDNSKEYKVSGAKAEN